MGAMLVGFVVALTQRGDQLVRVNLPQSVLARQVNCEGNSQGHGIRTGQLTWRARDMANKVFQLTFYEIISSIEASSNKFQLNLPRARLSVNSRINSTMA